MSDTGVVALYATFPDHQTAADIARTLVDERLVACANISPGITSIYRWDGKVVQEGEVSCLFKTSAGFADRAIARIKALHPHLVPCITLLPVNSGYAPYLRWVKEQLA